MKVFRYLFKNYKTVLFSLASGGLISISIAGHFLHLWIRGWASRFTLVGLLTIFIGLAIYIAGKKLTFPAITGYSWKSVLVKFLPLLGMSLILYLSLITQPVDVTTMKHRLEIESCNQGELCPGISRISMLELIVADTRLSPWQVDCNGPEYTNDGLSFNPISTSKVTCYFSSARSGGLISLLFEEGPHNGMVQISLDGNYITGSPGVNLFSENLGTKRVEGIIPANHLPAAVALIDVLSVSIFLAFILIIFQNKWRTRSAKTGWFFVIFLLVCIGANFIYSVRFFGMDGNFLGKIRTFSSNSFTNLINIGRIEEFNFFFGFYGPLHGKEITISPELEKDLDWKNSGDANIADMFDLKKYNLVNYNSELSAEDAARYSKLISMQYLRLDGKSKYALIEDNIENKGYVIMKYQNIFYFIPNSMTASWN